MKMQLKMKEYIFLLITLSILQVGCYEDKGNYDYTTVNEVKIEGEYDLVYRLNMGERLSIPMTLELNGFDESLLEFKWEFTIQNKLNPEYHLLSTSKDFDEEITLSPANYDLRYTILNTVTGLATYKRFNIEVTDAISKYTYLLLCRFRERMMSLISRLLMRCLELVNLCIIFIQKRMVGRFGMLNQYFILRRLLLLIMIIV